MNKKHWFTLSFAICWKKKWIEFFCDTAERWENAWEWEAPPTRWEVILSKSALQEKDCFIKKGRGKLIKRIWGRKKNLTTKSLKNTRTWHGDVMGENWLVCKQNLEQDKDKGRGQCRKCSCQSDDKQRLSHETANVLEDLTHFVSLCDPELAHKPKELSVVSLPFLVTFCHSLMDVWMHLLLMHHSESNQKVRWKGCDHRTCLYEMQK